MSDERKRIDVENRWKAFTDAELATLKDALLARAGHQVVSEVALLGEVSIEMKRRRA